MLMRKPHRRFKSGVHFSLQTENSRFYDNPIYIKWRLDVRKRDKVTCQMPGCGKKSIGIQVHHIKKWADFPALRYLTSNGICLCSKCHKSIKGKEEVYEGLLYSIALRNEIEWKKLS